MGKGLSMLLAAGLLAGCSVFGVRDAEQAPYDVLVDAAPIEVRRYPPLLVARTTVDTADYDEASGVGFRRLAGYIFGDNRQGEEIAMTVPVLQQPSGLEIAMTAPVLQQPSADGWRMSFVMPAGYTLDTLPKPNDDLVELGVQPEKTVAALRYSGFLNSDTDRRIERLRTWITGNGYRAASPPRLAGYDPPWTLPFLRRNEIQIDVARADAAGD